MGTETSAPATHIELSKDGNVATVTFSSERDFVVDASHPDAANQMRAVEEVLAGLTERDAELLVFNKVDRVTTPTLIMGGEEDWNVPIQNSEQLYQALRRLGVPTQLVVYPGQSHGLRPPSYQKDRYERYLEWYDKWVKLAQKPITDES